MKMKTKCSRNFELFRPQASTTPQLSLFNLTQSKFQLYEFIHTKLSV